MSTRQKNLFSCLIVISIFCFISNAYCKDKITVEVKSDNVNLYFPSEITGKLPVVIFAHNGGAKKEDWGDFPQKLASEGYFTATIGWSSFGGFEDISSVIDNVMNTYKDKLDMTKVAFVGGCHGGVKMTSIMSENALPYQIKTSVFLSVSENITLPEKHVPILGFYSTDDHLGDYYKNFTKSLLEKIITEPKKVIAVKGTSHGNELVTDVNSQETVRKEIVLWLKKYLSKA